MKTAREIATGLMVNRSSISTDEIAAALAGVTDDPEFLKQVRREAISIEVDREAFADKVNSIWRNDR
jgi:hypothetical protein